MNFESLSRTREAWVINNEQPPLEFNRKAVGMEKSLALRCCATEALHDQWLAAFAGLRISTTSICLTNT